MLFLLKSVKSSIFNSKIKSKFAVSINGPVIAIVSKFSVVERHFNSTVLFFRLQALKLTTF